MHIYFENSKKIILHDLIDIAGAPQPWNGLKMATSFSPVCPQNLPSLNNSQQHFTSGRLNHLKRLMQFLQNESEDCLFLNLYVPEWCKYIFNCTI